jgi:hypothetical protein
LNFHKQGDGMVHLAIDWTVHCPRWLDRLRPLFA